MPAISMTTRSMGVIPMNHGQGGPGMKKTWHLRDIGQSLWLDNITRQLLDNGGLGKYIDQLSVTRVASKSAALLADAA
jgi:hypothetical protein